MVSKAPTSQNGLFTVIDSVQLKDVSKRFGHTLALDSVNLEAIGGETLAIVGSKGCGKSTLLRALNRLIEVDSGTIQINNENIAKFDLYQLRASIGFLTKHPALLPHLTVRENLLLHARVNGWPLKRAEQYLQKILSAFPVSLDSFLDTHPSALSSDLTHHVALARTLLPHHPLLLMDDPFSPLDPFMRREIDLFFSHFSEERCLTVLFATSDVDEAFRISDRIAVMDKGKVVQIGEPDEILFNPANDFVVTLLDAERKFKHLELFRVKDVMKPLDSRHFFDGSLPVSAALERMTKGNVWLGVIIEGGVACGLVTLYELSKLNKLAFLRSVVKKPLLFSIHDSLSSALSRMKQENTTKALVVDTHETPVGILLADEILMKIVR